MEDLARTRRLLQELRGLLSIDEPMAVAVRRDLVPAVGDLLDEPRPLLADPSKNEERRANTGLVKEIEQTTGVGLDPTRHRRPGVPLDDAVEVRDLKMFLDVDGHRIEHR